MTKLHAIKREQFAEEMTETKVRHHVDVDVDVDVEAAAATEEVKYDSEECEVEMTEERISMDKVSRENDKSGYESCETEREVDEMGRQTKWEPTMNEESNKRNR